MTTNLTKAKVRLILEQPFFASLLYHLQMVESEQVPTMGTDGTRILYNPKFVESLTVPEITFVLAHEIMHCVFDHMGRVGSLDKQLYNVAADYIINDILVADKVGIMPKGGLHDSQLVAQGKTTEGVYALLPANTPPPPMQDIMQPGGDGTGKDTPADGNGPPNPGEFPVWVIQAANAAKMAGKLSAGMQRIVQEATRSKTDWRGVLRKFLSERAKVDWSYAKPKRRFIAEDIYLPGLTGEKMGAVVIAVDCSGSIDAATLDKFSAEIKGIIEDVTPSMTHVLYFDTAILRADSFSVDDAFKIEAVGGGGTAFSPIFEHIDSKDIVPAACVVLTDLECCDYGPMPDYPVLWASIGRDIAPWGEVVRIKD